MQQEKTQSSRVDWPWRILQPHGFRTFVSGAGRVYAIGDIHGRSDLLDRIITAIRSDLEANPVENCVTVTLGDYFDRGPIRAA